MKDFYVVNKYTHLALGMVRAASKQVAEALAHAIFGCCAEVTKKQIIPLLEKLEPEAQAGGAFASPRSLTAGTVGVSFAGDMMAYIDVADTVPSCEAIEQHRKGKHDAVWG